MIQRSDPEVVVLFIYFLASEMLRSVEVSLVYSTAMHNVVLYYGELDV